MRFKLICFILLIFVFSVFVSAGDVPFSGVSGSTARFVQYQQPDFNNYYSADQIRDYWPILSDGKDGVCEGRQDLLIQPAPFGCQPSVVRSDILAEQNFPVFCQLNALRVNPLIDIKQIRALRFGGNYPKEVVGVGFHPALAALRTRTQLLGDPFLNNIGYAVVVLRKQANESAQPKSLNFTLQAQVDYYAGNALGIGSSSFYLHPVSDSEWGNERFRQSFFKGRYFVRLDEVSPNSARISIYSGDVKVASRTLPLNGEAKDVVYLPGSYCLTGLRAYYDGSELARPLARLQVGDDVLDLNAGARFANDQCSVQTVNLKSAGEGNVLVSCGSSGSFDLKLSARAFSNGDKVRVSDKKFADVIYEVVSFDSNSKNYSLKGPEGKTISVNYQFIYSADGVGLTEVKSSDKDLESYFDKTVEYYKRVAREYPSEKRLQAQALDNLDSFGRLGLERAISLADEVGKQRTAVELINLYIEIYPDSRNLSYYSDLLNRHYKYDLSESVASVDLEQGVSIIRLVDIVPPSKVSSVSLSWGAGSQFNLPIEGSRPLSSSCNITLDRLDSNSAHFSVYDRSGSSTSSTGVDLILDSTRTGQGYSKSSSVCGQVLRLESIDLAEYAKIRLVPESRGPTIATNFTIGVGIEQRAIKLTPDAARDKIVALNATIQKWESISKNLGQVVTGLKTACLATAGVLTVKNFVTGLDGTALARQKVMRDPNGWTEWCRSRVKAVTEPSYGSIGECYSKNSDKIDKDVSTMNQVINSDNEKIKSIEGRHTQSSSSVFGSYVDGEASKNEFIKNEISSYNSQQIELADGTSVSVSDITKDVGGSSVLSYQEAKDLKLYLDMKAKSGDSPVAQSIANENLRRIATSASDRISSTERRVGLTSYLGGSDLSKSVLSYSNYRSVQGEWTGAFIGESDKAKLNGLPDSDKGKPAQLITGNNGQAYLVVLTPVSSSEYGVEKSYKINRGSDGSYSVGPAINGKVEELQFGSFRKVSRASCINKFEPNAAEVQYYETEPYKGMPAIVPFDLDNGWYVGTRQTVPAMGGLKSYQSSGKPASFWICNVGKDGRPDFFVNGFDDDICQQFNLETGAPVNKFSCLDDAQTKELVARAVRALEDAADQRARGASKLVSIEGRSVKVGNPATNLPGTQCQDFMSPDDCKLLFNVCDPVICPPSRCNLGGAYPVADVIQSGIVGSALLCLPNFNEGVYIPVCLTGIKAGIDGYLSILKSYQQCLQENIESGKYVGVCDQITSVYLCEFFWRQAAPVANILLPKLVEFAYGQNQVHGGGEYLTVQSAWDNAQQSVNYFTQNYAVNSFKAFQIRSVEDAGSEVCRSFISAQAPSQLKSLVEPDSPPQFHAWFSSIPYSDATVPATAQYKVFYHIYAGNDAGVSYTIYLKDPPQTSYYQTTSTIQVASGFAAKGKFATETKDFTAPAGYQQLCVRVNDQEECGFKQVTTSFALDSVRDEFVNDQIKQNDVTNEKECVSGRTNPSALLNPNLEEAAQEAIDPAIYNRGVTRICATANPGKATDPLRFVDVGFCGDQKVRCWLDTQSIDNALTSNNVGLKNATLSDMTNVARAQLGNDSDFLYGEGEDSEIKRLGDLMSKQSLPVKEGLNLIGQADSLFNKVILSNQKAELLFLQGRAYEGITRGLIQGIEQKNEVSSPVSSGGSSGQTVQNPPRDKWTLSNAYDYATNHFDQSVVYGSKNLEFKKFVDELYADNVISASEYDEIDGISVAGAYISGQENAKYVSDLLKSKIDANKQKAETNKLALLSKGDRIVLAKEYSPREKIYLWYDGKLTSIYLSNEKVVCEECGETVTDRRTGDSYNPNVNLGIIKKDNSVLTIVVNNVDSVKNILTRNGLSYDKLNGAIIELKSDGWYVCGSATNGQLECPPE